MLLRLINKQTNWKGIGALSVDDAKKTFAKYNFNIVLFNIGIEKNQEEHLSQHFKCIKKDILIIQHYGGGSGLLYNEIQYALENLKKPTLF